MILLLTSSLTGTADDLVSIFNHRGIPVFRFNTDLYYSYQFLWQGDTFEFVDPVGRVCNSNDIELCIMYKCVQWVSPGKQYGNGVAEPRYVTEILNELCKNIANWAMQKNILRLWHPDEYAYPKIKQMQIARKYFAVPPFSLHWGFAMPEKKVIVKQIVQRPLDDGGMPFVDIADRSVLDPAYPWFSQDIAAGNRDATVLYINGKIHCFQFATERGELTDWRITQGTEVNKWEMWNSGHEFELKVDAFMRELGLKFGRLDFIIGSKTPQFLEVNPRGQFGWLDDESLTLNNEVVDAILDPAATITL